MDLRVDYAFKLLFASGDARHLISLLNAIFENKQIPRIITNLTIVNPSLEKASPEDKLSVLDVRATLADGTSLCIEMHLYDLLALKYKSLRSWARVYGEELEAGDDYTAQSQVICISFINGAVTDEAGDVIEKIHSLFQVMERDSHEILLPDMELHYINMKAFVKYCDERPESETDYDNFTKWLMLITQKELKDKEAIRQICSEGEIKDAMDTLTRLSDDKIKRQSYQRRLDQIYFYNAEAAKKDALIAKQDTMLAKQATSLAKKDASLAKKDASLAEKDASLAEKDASLAEKDAIIAKLMAQIKNSGLHS